MSAVPLPSLSPLLGRVNALFASRAPRAPDVATLQQAALAQFIALGIPTTRDEAWKYTNLKRLESRALVLPEPVTAVDPDFEARLLRAPAWRRIVFVNGSHAPLLSSAASAEPGVRIRSLATVLRESADEGVKLLDSGDPSASARFELLNRAFVEDGLVIDVDAGVELVQPIYVVFASSGAGRAAMTSPRIIVRAGSNARLTLIEHHIAADRAEHVVNAVSRLSLAAGATVEHYRLRQESSQVIHLGSVSAEIGRSARYISHTLSLGGSLARLDLTARLTGEGASASLNGVFLADGTQHVDTHTCLEHLVPNTQSTEDYRGLADGKGRGVFNGKVIVHQQAQKTDARQSSRNLLLSATAEIDTRPELEIHADDVKCSHGATTGQLDPVALFYLRSRGISEQDARGLLAVAFVESVLAGMSALPVREHIGRFFRQYFLKSADGTP